MLTSTPTATCVVVATDSAELMAQARTGNVRAVVRVFGYWSNDPITVYFTRNWSYSETTGAFKWEVSISHSSGGRDTKQVESNIAASRNFALGMCVACDIADAMVANVDKFEQAYKDQRAIEQKEREQAQAEKQAKIDADEALGTVGAHRLVKQIKLLTTGFNRVAEVVVYERGNDEPNPYLKAGMGKVFVWTLNGRRVSEKEAVAYLATMSHRTHLPAMKRVADAMVV